MKQILSAKAPQPIGPYSQAVEAQGFVFASGQIALDAAGKIVSEDVAEQTEQVILNLEAVLQAAGLGLTQVVKTTIYLKNMDDFGLVNDIYGRFFNTSKPARATVEVSRLPKDVHIEMDCIAVKK